MRRVLKFPTQSHTQLPPPKQSRRREFSIAIVRGCRIIDCIRSHHNRIFIAVSTSPTKRVECSCDENALRTSSASGAALPSCQTPMSYWGAPPRSRASGRSASRQNAAGTKSQSQLLPRSMPLSSRYVTDEGIQPIAGGARVRHEFSIPRLAAIAPQPCLGIVSADARSCGIAQSR